MEEGMGGKGGKWMGYEPSSVELLCREGVVLRRLLVHAFLYLVCLVHQGLRIDLESGDQFGQRFQETDGRTRIWHGLVGRTHH